MTSTDRIDRSVFIRASPERVWELVTQAEHVGRWFADAGAQVDLRPGGHLSLSWRHGTVHHGRVETVDPPERFAFRWLAEAGSQAEPSEVNSTLAEFTMSKEADGTRVRVVESGFDALDMDASGRTALLASHTEGWGMELADLVEHAGEAA